VGAIAVLEAVHAVQRRVRLREAIAELPGWVRWSLYTGLVMSILVFGKAGAAKFIYFQF